MQNALNINYVIKGNGDNTILFLHGWEGSTKSFSYVQNEFAAFCKTVNIDFLGFGKSDSLIYPFDVYDYAFSVYELICKLKLNNITIVSHSFGGRVAIILSSIFKVNIVNLVLVDSAGLKPKFNLATKIKVLKFKLAKKLVKNKILNSRVLNKFGSADYKKLKPIMKKSFTKIVNQDLTYLLPKISCSTLIVWGKKDKSTPFYMAKILNKKINKSKLIVYKNAGHFSYLENLNAFCFTLSTIVF